MNRTRKDILIASIALFTIAGAIGWIAKWQFSAPKINTPLQEGVGRNMAEQTALALNQKGHIVVVTLEPGANKILDAQLKSFKAALSKWPGIEIAREDNVDSEKSGKYGPGAGMSARRFMKLREKYKDVDAIISFIGAPDAEDMGVADKKTAAGPELIAVSRSYKKLRPLLENGTLVCVFVPRFDFPAPGPENPKTPDEWFQNRFQVVKASERASK